MARSLLRAVRRSSIVRPKLGEMMTRALKGSSLSAGGGAAARAAAVAIALASAVCWSLILIHWMMVLVGAETNRGPLKMRTWRCGPRSSL